MDFYDVTHDSLGFLTSRIEALRDNKNNPFFYIFAKTKNNESIYNFLQVDYILVG